MDTTDRYPTDYDPTDLGVTPSIDNFWTFRRPPRIPVPRPPVEEVPPASRPDLHMERIYRMMGWTRNERIKSPCSGEGGCLARPGAPCTTPTGKIMSGFHPGR